MEETMPIRVKIANSPSEMDGLFQARHRVFVEEEKYFPERPGRRIYDRYDSFPTTVNLVSMVDRKVVGGLRLTEWSESGVPSDEIFDFNPYISGNSKNLATASMLCLERAFRDLPRLCFMMLCMGIYWCLSRKISHVTAAINPVVKELISAIGFRPVASEFYDEEHGVNVLPMLLDLGDTDLNFLEMSGFQGFDSSLKAFDRELYRKGEKIITRGTKGDAAYIIVKGEVMISRPGRRSEDSSDHIFFNLGPCDLFGELSLLTNKPLSADAVAMTDVDLMVIEKDVFWEQLKGDPDLQLKLLRMIGNRLIDTVERIPSQTFRQAGNWT
jgi:N-acyl-L-homoserine lactone synthetase